MNKKIFELYGRYTDNADYMAMQSIRSQGVHDLTGILTESIQGFLLVVDPLRE